MAELFGDEEKNILKWSIGVRETMVKDKMEEGINTNGDMRVVSETLNGLDSSILQLGKLDQDDKKLESDKGMQDAMLDIMKKAKMTKRTPTAKERARYVDDDVFDGEILDTELQEPGRALIVEDFLDEEM